MKSAKGVARHLAGRPHFLNLHHMDINVVPSAKKSNLPRVSTFIETLRVFMDWFLDVSSVFVLQRLSLFLKATNTAMTVNKLFRLQLTTFISVQRLLSVLVLTANHALW